MEINFSRIYNPYKNTKKIDFITESKTLDMNSKLEVTIYVALLNEGTLVWRPVQALVLENGIYQIISNRDKDEDWEFETGNKVRCETKPLEGKNQLVAISLVAVPS